MHRYQLKIFLIACCFLGIFAGQIYAGSFYSSKGIGLVRYFINGRSAGMGGVGLALVDVYAVNYLNPAPLVALPLTTLSGSFLHEATDLKNSTQDAFITDTNVYAFQFAVPLKQNRAVLALGVNPYSSIEFSFSARDSSGQKSYTEVVSGDGGVNTGFVTLAIHPYKNLYLGITGLYYFGTLKNIWRVIFDSSQFTNTQDEVTRSFTDASVRFGMLYTILPGWSVAGVLAPRLNLDANQSITLQRITEFTDLPDSSITIPLSYGIGTALQFGKFTLGLDYYTQRWSDFREDGFVNDSRRIAMGFEFFPKGTARDSYFSRVAYRAGFFYHDLGLVEANGEKVTEMFGSLGLGLPIKWGAAKLDLSLEIGKRGSLSSNTFRETVIRFMGSVTVAEKWFLRGGR